MQILFRYISILMYRNDRDDVEMRPDETVQDLLEKVKELKDIPMDQQRLVWRGRLISDYPSRTLRELDIVDGDVIHVLPPRRN